MTTEKKPFDFQRHRELADMVTQMTTETGRRFVHRLLEQAGVFTQSFTTDSHITAFNEGRRSRGLALLADLMESCPESYLTMIQEAHRLAVEDAKRLAHDQSEGENE